MMAAKSERSIPLTWIAEYKDGSTVTQYREDGSQNSYVNLKREGLTAFGLVNHENKPVVIVPLNEDRVLFFRMRVFGVGTEIRKRIYILGYRTKTGETHVSVVDEEGKTKTCASFHEAKVADLEFYEQEQV